MPRTPMVNRTVATPTAFAARSAFFSTISQNFDSGFLSVSPIEPPFCSGNRLKQVLQERTSAKASTNSVHQQERVRP